ncbi:MAG: hypothetical protein HY518_00390, partial [Candidatus Aenigmarchaeota archaeon]|nr:hypothetical protein [Candidatus Aenigmarchaeota archaeon]
TTDGSTYSVATSNTTNSSGFANFYFNASCSPKHEAQTQKWKVSLAGDALYKNNDTDSAGFGLVLDVWGTLNLTLSDPDGSQNFTQGDSITFLGSVFDDCIGSSISPTVNYFANYTNITNSSMRLASECKDITVLGANAFRCNLRTDIFNHSTWYNVSMQANLTSHYSNSTSRTGSQGLFFLNPIRQLADQAVSNSISIYTVPNWNFSVRVRSGNYDNTTIHLLLKKGAESFSECSGTTCVNGSVTICTYCINRTVWWERNFSSSDVGTWFYQIQMKNNATGTVITQTSGTDSFEVQDISLSPYYITLDNFVRSPTSAGWGFNFTFNVTVQSNSNRNVSVFLWRSTTGTDFTSVRNVTQNFSTKTDVNLTIDVQPNETDASTGSQTWFYKFNATDFNSTAPTTNTTTSLTVTVTKDAIILEFPFGNTTVANRTDNQTSPLYIRLRDGNGTVIGAGRPANLSVTTDGSSYGSPISTTTNSSGFVNFDFNATCSPKHKAQTQKWKISITNDPLYQNNDTDSAGLGLVLDVWGTINLSLTDPDGSSNFTQGQTITFLGTAYDDCIEVITPTPTVNYFANYTNSSGQQSLECTPVTKLGENAFRCLLATTVSTLSTFYNASIQSNASYHYPNSTRRTGSQGLFFLDPFRELVDQQVVPSSGLYTATNWNFSVRVSSGNNDNLSLNLLLKKGAASFSECLAPTCVNGTSRFCTNCINKTIWWERNFTSADVGTWFFQMQMVNNATGAVVTQTGGTDSFEVQDVSASSFYVTLDNFVRSPTSAGWGFNFSFNITARSSSNRNVSVELWRSTTGVDPFTRTYNITLNLTNSTDINVSFDAQPSDTDPITGSQTVYFKFNATDNNNSAPLRNTTSSLT